MKRLLTDYEYQINGGTWTNSTADNTTDNGDGTYTIYNGLDIVIPIGGLKVRVKALEGNPPSDALTNNVAFTGTATTARPNVIFNPNTLAVGDTDKLLNYTSDSAGVAMFTSSDPTKATIVLSEGNAYLHAAAEGPVNVTLSQPASGAYPAFSITKTVYIVTKTTVDDITYSTLALGKAATPNGSSFNITNANTYTLRKYLMVDGKAVYQSTIPSTVLTTAKAIKEKIYNEELGIMPGTPTVDIDSSFAAYHCNKLKNIGGTAILDNNISQFNRFSKQTGDGGGALNINNITDVQVKLDYINAGSISEGFAFIASPHKNVYFPPGLWTISMEIKLLPGDSGKSIFAGISIDTSGDSYQEWPLTDQDQTFSIQIDYENETDMSWGLCLASGRTAANAFGVILSVIVSNVRITPGTIISSPSALIADPTLYVGTDYMPKGLKNDLSLVMYDFIKSPFGNSFVHFDTTAINSKHISIMFAMKIPVDKPTWYATDIIMADIEEFDILSFYANGYINPPDSMFSQAKLASFTFNRNEWFVLTLTIDDGTNIDAYIDGFRVFHQDRISASKIWHNLYFLGMQNVYAGYGYFSGLTFWRSKLSPADVITAANLMKKRMQLKNHFVDDSSYYYFAEGDSITFGNQVDTYSKLLRNDYTPQLFGANSAVNGSTLGVVGDASSTNSVYGRQAVTINCINEALANNRKVVMTLLIGTNDMPFLTTSDLVISYYNSLCTYVSSMRMLGVKVAMCTILDIADSYMGSDKTFLIQLNNLIRSDPTRYDGLMDFYADPAFQIATTTYYNSDLIHPNSAGVAKMYDIAKPVFNDLLAM